MWKRIAFFIVVSVAVVLVGVRVAARLGVLESVRTTVGREGLTCEIREGTESILVSVREYRGMFDHGWSVTQAWVGKESEAARSGDASIAVDHEREQVRFLLGNEELTFDVATRSFRGRPPHGDR